MVPQTDGLQGPSALREDGTAGGDAAAEQDDGSDAPLPVADGLEPQESEAFFVPSEPVVGRFSGADPLQERDGGAREERGD